MQMRAQWRTYCSLACICSGFFWQCTAQAQEIHPQPDAFAATPAQTVTSEPFRSGQDQQAPAKQKHSFLIQINAPQEIRELVDRFLELKRYQQVPDLDNVELLRLLELSENQIRNLLSTQGYFTPEIDQMLRADKTSTTNNSPPEIVITIDPGSRTHIKKLDLQIEGPAQTYAPAWQQLAQIRFDWGLPIDTAFTQSAWAKSKEQALQSLKSTRFAAARLVDSKATIDPDSSSATLQLLYESGPVYRYGAVQVQGAKRYDAIIAQRFARLPAGAEYRQSDLLQAQQRLLKSGYYEGASLVLDTDTQADPNTAPVQVTVQEFPLQKLVFGIGFNTDSGPGISIEHTHNRIPALHWRALTKLKWNQDQQIFSASLLSPPNDGLWQRLINASYLHDSFGSTRQTTQQARLGRTKNDGVFERTVYLQFDRSKADYGNNIIQQANALSANYVWTMHRFNSLIFPTSGFGLALEFGGGSTLSPQRDPFIRTAARYMGFFSLDKKSHKLRIFSSLNTRRNENSGEGLLNASDAASSAALVQALAPRKNGELVLRLEAAALRTRDNAIIPPNLLFLTGGNASVRGYGYQQIGVLSPKGVIEPGRYSFVSSLEYRRPVWRKGHATDWDSIVFVDAGNVANSPAGLRHLKYGVGTGAIWRSPVGPVQLAIAYGVQERKVRLHMNLGFTF